MPRSDHLLLAQAGDLFGAEAALAQDFLAVLAGVGWRMPVLLTVQSALVIGVAYLIAVWLF